MAISFAHPRPHIVDGNGNPYAGAKLYFYDPGTTTARTVYQDADLTSAHTQPVIADSAGRWSTIYLPTGAYKVRCETSANVLIYEQDDCDPGVATGPGALPVLAGGTGGTNAAAARTNLGAAAAADLSTLQTTVTEHIAKVSPSFVGGTRLGTLAGLDDLRVEDLGSEFSSVVVKRHYWESQAVVTSTATTPAFDNTIPQSGEGTEVFSHSFTPARDDSYINVTAHLTVGGGNGNVIVFMCDGSSDAIAVTHQYIASAFPGSVTLRKRIPSWGVTSKTISIRIGSNAQPQYLNKGPSADFGGSLTSSVLIEEIVEGPF